MSNKHPAFHIGAAIVPASTAFEIAIGGDFYFPAVLMAMTLFTPIPWACKNLLKDFMGTSVEEVDIAVAGAQGYVLGTFLTLASAITIGALDLALNH